MINDKSVFHLISDLTQREGVSCILIGGFAVNYYQFSRNTADIDFLITEEDFQKIKPLLKKAGYGEIGSHENFAQLKSNKLSLMALDFMFVDEDTFSKIKKEAKEIKIAGQKLIVPSLPHLIALKLHSIKNNPKIRLSKDLPDIIGLIKINKLSVKDKSFKDLCLKYGTEDIYKNILEVCS